MSRVLMRSFHLMDLWPELLSEIRLYFDIDLDSR